MGLAVFLACLFTVLAATSYWVHNTALDTDHFVETVTPIGQDPAVTEALSLWMSDQLLEVVDARKVIADALPEQARLLAAPLANAVRTFVQEQIDNVLQSDAFARAWAVANTAAHATAVAILRDETGSDVVRTSNGKVVLNLLPLLNEALRQVQEASPEILGREVELPEIKPEDIPADARQRIQDALGVTVPANFGEIGLFSSEDLDRAQDFVWIFDRAVVGVIIVAFLLVAFTVWVSKRRRRTVIQLGIGVAVGFIIFRRLAILAKNNVLDDIEGEVNRDGFDAALSEVLGKYLGFTAWLTFFALLAAAVAYVAGPYPRAVQLRRVSRRLVRGAASEVAKAGAEYEDEPVLRWLRTNHVHLQAGAAIVVLLVVLLFDLSLLSLLLLSLLLVMFEFVLYFLTVGRLSTKSERTPPNEAVAELEPVAAGEIGPSSSDTEEMGSSSGDR